MGRMCIICKHYYQSNDERSLHKFPLDRKLRVLWCDILGLQIDKITKFSRICSIHFTKDQFHHRVNRKFLNKDAVPFNGRLVEKSKTQEPPPPNIVPSPPGEYRVKQLIDLTVDVSMRPENYQTITNPIANNKKPSFFTSYQQFLFSQLPRTPGHVQQTTNQHANGENMSNTSSTIPSTGPECIQTPETPNTPYENKLQYIQSLDLKPVQATQKTKEQILVLQSANQNVLQYAQIPDSKLHETTDTANQQLLVLHSTDENILQYVQSLGLKVQEVIQTPNQPLLTANNTDQNTLQCIQTFEPKPCETSGISSDDSSSLYRDEPVKAYECKICSFETIYEDIFKEHMLIHRPPEKRTKKETFHKCPRCPFKMQCRASLKKHMAHDEKSTGDRLYCGLYKYSAQCARLLDSHWLSHKNDSDWCVWVEHSYAAL